MPLFFKVLLHNSLTHDLICCILRASYSTPIVSLDEFIAIMTEE